MEGQQSFYFVESDLERVIVLCEVVKEPVLCF